MALTAKDMLDRLIDYQGGNVGQGATRDAKRAIQDALRDLGSAHRWSYLMQELLFTTDAPQSTGTIAYTASTRQVTLTSSTWPSWAQYGVIKIGDIHSRVYRAISSTVLELETNSASGTDVASGTSYVLYRDTYPFPQDFHQASLLIRSSGRECLTWVPPEQWQSYGSAYVQSSGRPLACTYLGFPEGLNRMALQLSPYPTQAETLRTIYKRFPRNIVNWEYKTGTVAATGSTVTGTGTAFRSDMQGSVFRIGLNSAEYPSEFENPPLEEFRIVNVASGTSFTVDGTFSTTYSGVKYALADPIDIDNVMMNCFVLCCFKKICEQRTMQDKPNAQALFEFELKQAIGSDLRTMERKQVGAYGAGKAWWPV